MPMFLDYLLVLLGVFTVVIYHNLHTCAAQVNRYTCCICLSRHDTQCQHRQRGPSLYILFHLF